jgi:hypothetical protein
MRALDGAYIRLGRAEEHIAELKDLGVSLLEREMEIVLDGIRANMKFAPSISIPLKYSVLIGETIYNLRAALDYLIYELAILDSGTMQERTQFPIYDTPNGFRGRPRTCLGGISEVHTTAIELLQPYNGVDWTKRLQSISNPDKHRHLVVAQPTGTVDFTTSPDPANPAGVEVQLYIDPFIAFDDGLPVIDTLEEIKAQVANVLAHFKLEF